MSDDLCEVMQNGIASLGELVAVRAEDGEFDEADIKNTVANLHSIEDALNCELEKIEEARRAAASHAADKTSERV